MLIFPETVYTYCAGVFSAGSLPILMRAVLYPRFSTTAFVASVVDSVFFSLRRHAVSAAVPGAGDRVPGDAGAPESQQQLRHLRAV